MYDPKNPVPTNGGGTLIAGTRPGPIDQSQIEEREDILVYTSEPLTEPLEVTGPVKVKLWVKSDVVDTDFTAKLIDVTPEGKALHLTDGIRRVKVDNQNQAVASGHRFMGNKQCVLAGSLYSCRNLIKQFPALRYQFKYRENHDREFRSKDRHTNGLSPRRISFTYYITNY